MEKIGAYTDRVTDSGEWRPGNPATGQQATPMLSQYFNMLQRELVNVVESTGNVLNKEDDTQLLTAINQLIGGAIGEKLIVRASASTALTDKQMGLVLIDASGQDVTIALPAADAALGVVDVILWRTDGTARTCTIAPAGVDRIMRDTAQYPAGQSSETLQFSGDWLHLRSDGSGKWWSVGAASTPLNEFVKPLGLGPSSLNAAHLPGGMLAGVTFNSWWYSSLPADLPFHNGHVFHQQISDDYAFQYCVPGAGVNNSFAIRRKTNGVWGDWSVFATASDVTSRAIGYDQVYRDVTSERYANVKYTNTSGQPILISIACYGTNSTTPEFGGRLEVDGELAGRYYNHVSSARRSQLTAIVGVGATYELIPETGLKVDYWIEMRS